MASSGVTSIIDAVHEATHLLLGCPEIMANSTEHTLRSLVANATDSDEKRKELEAKLNPIMDGFNKMVADLFCSSLPPTCRARVETVPRAFMIEVPVQKEAFHEAVQSLRSILDAGGCGESAIVIVMYRGHMFAAADDSDAFDEMQARALLQLAEERGWSLQRAGVDDSFNLNNASLEDVEALAAFADEFCGASSGAAVFASAATRPTLVFEMRNGGNLYLGTRDSRIEEAFLQRGPPKQGKHPLALFGVCEAFIHPTPHGTLAFGAS
jgi:hypothetical protein